MNKIKIVILILILFNYGCATIKTIDLSNSSNGPKAVIKGLLNKESTLVRTSFKVIGVNGKPVDYGLTGHPVDSIIYLDEGNNKIVVGAARYDNFFKGVYSGIGEINVFLSGGKKYQVNGTYDGLKRLIRMWVEDMATKEKVSNVVDLYLVAK